MAVGEKGGFTHSSQRLPLRLDDNPYRKFIKECIAMKKSIVSLFACGLMMLGASGMTSASPITPTWNSEVEVQPVSNDIWASIGSAVIQGILGNVNPSPYPSQYGPSYGPPPPPPQPRPHWGHRPHHRPHHVPHHGHGPHRR